jgi:hypothetical protein
MRPLYADFLTQAAAVLDEPALDDAAAGYAEAGRLWTRVADEALAGPMAPYAALLARRRELLSTPGQVDELRAIAHEAAALVENLDVGEPERLARLDVLAELAADVVRVERQACDVLRDVARQ